MADYEEYKEGLEYSKEVKNAVRYGYQYRKEAEENKDSNVKYCIGDPSEILYWIANMIIGGLSWDLLKYAVKKASKWISKRRIKTDQETIEILTNEIRLKIFYEYIKEFEEHKMSVDNKTLKYIKEEIVADYVSNIMVEKYLQKEQPPEPDEYVKIIRDAFIYADNMLDGENAIGEYGE